MDPTEKARFDSLYQQHLSALKRCGLSDRTMDVYARAIRRNTAKLLRVNQGENARHLTPELIKMGLREVEWVICSE